MPHYSTPYLPGLRCLSALLFPVSVWAQSLTLDQKVLTYGSLTNTEVILTNRSELWITGTGDPLTGSLVHLNSPDAWLVLPAILPATVASSLLGYIRVSGAPAVLNGNVRVVSYGIGAVVIPQSPDFAPLRVHDDRYFTGKSKRLTNYTEYNNALLGGMTAAIRSFTLKRGYMATFASSEDGTADSRCYVAQDGDLEVGILPAALDAKVRFIRVFPWRWTAKKGIAGNITSTNPLWSYNWNLDQNSSLNKEYVAIRQTRYWPGLAQNWKTRGINHLLGFNEPDHADQANLTVAEGLNNWPVLMQSGLRLGSPAPSDGGLSWLYSFLDQADASGKRVDFVAVHYYRSYSNAANAAGTASQFYNFLKGVHDRTKRPLWITEWNNGANWTSDPDPTFVQQQAAVAAMIEMLDNTSWVERYAIYNWVEDVRRVSWDDGSLTAAGTTYRDKVSPIGHRQGMPDAGTGTSSRYSFDGDTRDMWGNGQDGLRVGAPRYLPGKAGLSLVLNGTSDYLQLSPRVGDTANWSFAGWVYWDGGGNWQRIFDLGSDGGTSLFLTPKSGNNTLRFTINSGGGEQQLNTVAMTPGVWTHLAVTISGNTGKLFVNGSLANTNTAMTAHPVDVGTEFNYIGKSQFAVDPLFSGRIDDFRFSSGAFTDAQVALMAGTAPPLFIANPLWKPEATPGLPYSDTLAGTVTGGAGALTFNKMGGPAWLSVSASGVLSGTPTLADAGANEFLVRVSDAAASAVHTTTLTIIVPPVLSAIAASGDDAEESSAGVVSLTSSDLELVNDGAAGDQMIGLRFTDVVIPQGAVLTSATIQFTADETQSEPTALEIRMETADDAAPFAESLRNLSSRTLSTTSVPWHPAPWNVLLEAGSAQRTPNLAGLVQSIVSRPGWSGGRSMAFLISGSGHRTAESFDLAGSGPVLSLTYRSMPALTVTSAVLESADDAEQGISGAVSLNSTDLEMVYDTPATGDQIVGMRFQNLAIPAGATIRSARLQFSADEAQSEPTSLTLRAQSVGNSPDFTTGTNNLSARPLTIASVAWSPPPWALVDERGPAQRPPDLRSLVQEVVSRPDWMPGNALALIVSGTGHRTADSFDDTGGIAPVLSIDYQLTPPPGTYAAWAGAAPSLTNPEADPDNDGNTNLLEYFLGLDPAAPDSPALNFTRTGSVLTLTYTRPTQIADVTATVEWSDDPSLGPWSSAGVSEQILSDSGTLQIRQATFPAGSNRRFVHLKVSR